ncbi:MAG: hypothetical protein RJA10_1530, partial [Pseudomonadota bacterium]
MSYESVLQRLALIAWAVAVSLLIMAHALGAPVAV